MNETKKIRVLMLLDYLNISGTKTHVLGLAKGFMKKGIHVVIAGKRGAFSPIFEQAGFPVYHINFFGNAAKIKAKLEKIIKIEKITVIHTHSPRSGLYAAEISKSLNLPLVGTFHGTYYDNQKMLKIAAASNTMISVSPAVKQYWGSLGVQSEYIPLTIDLTQFSYRSKTNICEQFGINNKSPIILYAARQEGKKAKIALRVIEACSMLRQNTNLSSLQCVIAGDGYKIGKIKEKAEEYNNQSGEAFIHVIGKYYDMPSLFSASTVVVGTGLTAIEAMACERPLIAAGIQGFIGLIDERNVDKAWNNGFGDHKFDKLPAIKANRIAENLKELLLDSQKQIHLGKMGRSYVERHFDVSINNKIIGIYQSVIQEKLDRN